MIVAQAISELFYALLLANGHQQKTILCCLHCHFLLFPPPHQCQSGQYQENYSFLSSLAAYSPESFLRKLLLLQWSVSSQVLLFVFEMFQQSILESFMTNEANVNSKKTNTIKGRENNFPPDIDSQNKPTFLLRVFSSSPKASS
jgi:hypothetical protein